MQSALYIGMGLSLAIILLSLAMILEHRRFYRCQGTFKILHALKRRALWDTEIKRTFPEIAKWGLIRLHLWRMEREGLIESLAYPIPFRRWPSIFRPYSYRLTGEGQLELWRSRAMVHTRPSYC